MQKGQRTREPFSCTLFTTAVFMVYSRHRSPSSSPSGQSALKSHSLTSGIPGPWWQWYLPSSVMFGPGEDSGRRMSKRRKTKVTSHIKCFLTQSLLCYLSQSKMFPQRSQSVEYYLLVGCKIRKWNNNKKNLLLEAKKNSSRLCSKFTYWVSLLDLHVRHKTQISSSGKTQPTNSRKNAVCSYIKVHQSVTKASITPDCKPGMTSTDCL